LQSQRGVEFGGFATRLIGAGSAIFFYLGKFIFPVNLMPIYPRWNLDTPSFLQVMALPTLVVLLFGFWTQRKGWGRHVLFGFGFFLLNLLPVLGLVRMANDIVLPLVADHLCYIPPIGLIGLIVLALEQLYGRLSSLPYLLGIGPTAAVLAIGLLSWESNRYARLFRNNETLWDYNIRHNPNAVAYNNLGIIFLRRGQFPEAIEQFEQSLKINSGNHLVHNNLGLALVESGRLLEAIEQFERALKIRPDYADARENLHQAQTLLKLNPAKN